MADYQRILSYLYRYEKAEKKECFGFVKAEQKSGSLKLTIQIDDERLLQGMELKLCFYERQGESWQVWQLDTLITQEHKEEIHLTYPAAMLPAGFRIKGQSGVLLYYQDAFYYGSVWIGEEIPTETLEPLRWHKIVNSAKDKSQMQENKSGKDIAGKISEKQTETEKILPDKMSEKQKVSTRNITDEMLQEQQESEENILEKKGQINTESFEEKDFQKRAENKIENIKSEENLPDSENDIAHSNNTNIEESVKIKEFSENNYSEIIFNYFSSDYSRNMNNSFAISKIESIKSSMEGVYGYNEQLTEIQVLDLIQAYFKTSKIKYSFAYQFRTRKNVPLYNIVYATPNKKGLEEIKDTFWRVFDGNPFFLNYEEQEKNLEITQQFQLFNDKDLNELSYSKEAQKKLINNYYSMTISYDDIVIYILENTMLRKGQVIKTVIKPLIYDGKIVKLNKKSIKDYTHDLYSVVGDKDD